MNPENNGEFGSNCQIFPAEPQFAKTKCAETGQQAESEESREYVRTQRCHPYYSCTQNTRRPSRFFISASREINAISAIKSVSIGRAMIGTDVSFPSPFAPLGNGLNCKEHFGIGFFDSRNEFTMHGACKDLCHLHGVQFLELTGKWSPRLGGKQRNNFEENSIRW
jgi:hypothetical protein